LVSLLGSHDIGSDPQHLLQVLESRKHTLLVLMTDSLKPLAERLEAGIAPVVVQLRSDGDLYLFALSPRVAGRDDHLGIASVTSST
jgi:hypothetical protein